MRLQLIGNFSLNEFQEAISVVIKDLKFAEIDSLRNVNIYTGVCVKRLCSIVFSLILSLRFEMDCARPK